MIRELICRLFGHNPEEFWVGAKRCQRCGHWWDLPKSDPIDLATLWYNHVQRVMLNLKERRR